MQGKTYEAAVKLNTGQVVVYHNINTGLLKFHKFIEEKFSQTQIWLYYRVRRKKSKEIVGTFTNTIKENKKCVIIYSSPIQNSNQTGYFLPIPYERNSYTITRNVFVANSQIIDINSDYIVVTQVFFNRMIERGRLDLYKYYLEQNHRIEENEISLGEINIEIFDKEIKKEGVYPQVDFP